MLNSQTKANGVKGVSSTEADPSPGKDNHAQQVVPDRQHATVRNKECIKIGTWNVRTLYQAGKLDNVRQEMDRLEINILGICETRWSNNGEVFSEEHRMIYSGGEHHERGVGLILDKERSKCVLGYWQLSDRVLLVKLRGKPFNISLIVVYAPTSDSTDEESDKFYDTLDMAKAQCKSQEITIVMGDLNAKVGKEQKCEIVGKHGLGSRNERGEKWVQWCTANNQVITNTWFEEHPRRLWTWKSPGGDTKNQIDFVTINKRFRNAARHCKTYPSADCGSDHLPVICKLMVKLQKLKQPKTSPKLQYSSLHTDSELRRKYAIEVKNRFEALTDVTDAADSKWTTLKKVLVTTARGIIPKKEKQTKKKWMTNDILELMRKRQHNLNRESEGYKSLDKEIKTKCRDAKEEWLSLKCAEIERKKNINPAEMHKNINEIAGQKFCSSSGCIKSKEGNIIMEKGKILERWTEYIKELFHDDRGEKPAIHKNLDGPNILKSEVRAALAKMKRNKAAGPDEIVTEMITALEEFGIEKLTEVVNEIYDSGEIPDDLSKSIFIALPKKPGATECELHRTISLMSHIIKLILRIIMIRARNKIRPEIGEQQYGFVQDAATRNAIFMVRMLSERAIEMQKDLYICFIDYTKAFDKVQHEKLWKLIENLDLDGKDMRLIRNLYWDQTACIRLDTEMSGYTKIERGVRQGCVFSPDLFNLYSEMILRELEGMAGFIVGGVNINNLRYADDTVLLAESEEELQDLLDKVVDESKKKGLTINSKKNKTECMVVSKGESPRCELKIGDITIQKIKKFNYLGSMITEDGRCDTEIRRRIGIAKDSFQKLNKILKDRKLTMGTKIRVLDCYVLSILLYGSECWTISPPMKQKLEAVEMWFYRRMLRISWTDHATNEEVLRRAGTKRKLINKIRKRQLQFLGHIMRKGKLENLSLTGKIEGKRSRGRQRLTFLKSVSNWIAEGIPARADEVKEQNLLRATGNRELWKTMIADVLDGYGT
ncbi:MAG: hypothetical protein K0U41_08180 [Gammaproteobacteria bacterium]|nr:hypothetical protein [Gammaproteobacteria bacterium]